LEEKIKKLPSVLLDREEINFNILSTYLRVIHRLGNALSVNFISDGKK
jgi:hypothetical protein